MSDPPAQAVAAVVPTLGRSGHLRRCLEALAGVHRIVVVPEAARAAVPEDVAEAVVAAPGRLGFSAATNRGIAAAGERAFVATVNDDALVEPGWAAALLAALSANPNAAAAQGVNLRLDAPGVVDGWGLAWNRRWQASQLGAGGSPPPITAPPRAVFGVSATAALYRTAALQAIATPYGIFDERLDSFYEDVELAGRLRAAGYDALTVPAARARHAGSTTAARRPLRRTVWIYGNRHLALSALLGTQSGAARARAVRADVVDLLRAILHPAVALGIVGGWGRAFRHRRAWRRSGPPLVPLGELARWRGGAEEAT